MRRAGLIMCALLAVGACGGGSAATAPATKAPATGGPAVATAPGGQVGGTGTSVAHVEVKSGPQAGKYDATGAKVDCNMSSTGSGATYQDLTASGLSGLTFASGVGGADPATFYFQALFGPFSLTQPTLEISTLVPTAPDGTGTAHLDDNGSTIKWTINGMTKDGVAITATIECGPVDRN
jgi:hypothetical protein